MRLASWRWTSLLLLCLCPSPGLARGLDVAVQAGRVTARLHEVPLEEALRALAEAARAELRGTVPEDRRVSASFENLDLEPALERLLGDLSFVLVYDASGALRAIELRGGPVEPPADASRPEAELDLTGWPPSERVREAAERLHAFALSDRRISIAGLLRRSLGDNAVTFRTLAQAAITNADSRVRMLAARRALRALEAEAPEREALRTVLEETGDELLTAYLRRLAGEQAIELSRAVARATHSPAVRGRARVLATRLAAATPPRPR